MTPSPPPLADRRGTLPRPRRPDPRRPASCRRARCSPTGQRASPTTTSTATSPAASPAACSSPSASCCWCRCSSSSPARSAAATEAGALGRPDRPAVRTRLRRGHLRGRLPGRRQPPCTAPSTASTSTPPSRSTTCASSATSSACCCSAAAPSGSPSPRCRPDSTHAGSAASGSSPGWRCWPRPRWPASDSRTGARLVWMVWFVGVGVLLLRHRDRAPTRRRGDATSAADRCSIGHS